MVIPVPIPSTPSWRRLVQAVAVFLIPAALAAAPDTRPHRLTLDAALDRVISTDQNIAIADYEVRKARVEQARVWSRMLPSLTATGNARWQGERRKEVIEIEEPASPAPIPVAPTTPGAGVNPPPVLSVPRTVRESRWTRTRSNQQSAGIDFSQPILDFTLGPARRQGELGRQIVEWQLRQRLREILFAVAQQYFEVLKQEKLVEEGRKTLGLTNEQVRLAEARLEAEEVIESDLLRARVDDERARRNVIQSENDLALAQARLGVALGLPPTILLDLVEPPKGGRAVAHVGEAVTEAQSRREEVKQAQLTLRRTHAERDEIKARYAPTLDFQVGQDIATGSSFERSIGWTAGLALNWQIFDRGQRIFDLKSNRLQINQEGLRIEEANRVVTLDVVDAWHAIELLRRTIPSLIVERTAAEENYRVQQEKYRSGLTTSLEVQTAIRDLAQARAQLVSATYDIEIAYRDLENVIATFENERVDKAMLELLSPGTRVAPTESNR